MKYIINGGKFNYSYCVIIGCKENTCSGVCSGNCLRVCSSDCMKNEITK